MPFCENTLALIFNEAGAKFASGVLPDPDPLLVPFPSDLRIGIGPGALN